MKTSSPSSRSAFTLVELLVVIGIIAILMGLLLGVIPAVQNNTRKAEAAQTVQTVTVAANAYFSDYNRFPAVDDMPPGMKDTVVGDPGYGAQNPNNALFYTLRNIPKGMNAEYRQNPRKVGYMTDKGAALGSSGKPRSGFFDRTAQGEVPPKELDGCLFDPWGVQYGIVLDTTGDERIDLAGFYTDYSGDNPESGRAPRNKRAGAFCVGKDGKLGKNGNMQFRSGTDTSDDVISFQ